VTILGTSLSLTLGAWRIRFTLSVDDDIDERSAGGPRAHHIDVARVRERA
jgi:hypothetical protein